jgi:hypothetical protein
VFSLEKLGHAQGTEITYLAARFFGKRKLAA